MRLLKLNESDQFTLTRVFDDDDPPPPYAILSHTWGKDDEEVTFVDIQTQQADDKAGYAKLRFCGQQAKRDGIEHFWVDTCCINKADLVELSESITSMFRWYRNAVKCYVYLSDVSSKQHDARAACQKEVWEGAFRNSRWFRRGWTLQELLAPTVVEFFSVEQELLGEKQELANLINEISTIPISALHGKPLAQFSVAERMRWTENRNTKKKEDKAYCLFGIFDVYLPLIYGEGDRAFVRLEKEISGQNGGSTKTVHAHWIIPRSSNPLFTGRGDLLQELQAIIRNAVDNPQIRTQCRLVIHGMGGQGKSEICLQLVSRLRNLFWAVLWVDVSTYETAERSLLDIAQRLALSAETWQNACSEIANLKQPWLLVLDNADDPDIDYADYFPDSTLGVVILTSRNVECGQYATSRSISLPGLSIPEAQDLLLKAARIAPERFDLQRKSAETVANLLQSHALALIQAGAYISRNHCTLENYPQVYEHQRRRLLAFRPNQARSRYRDVYATFEVSVDAMNKMHTNAARDALQLLSFLAFCGSSRFPLLFFGPAWKSAKDIPENLDDHAKDDANSLMTPWHVAHFPAFMGCEAKEWDSFPLMEAVFLLKTLSLVSITDEGDSSYASLHALVRAWARDRQSESEQYSTWLQVACVVGVSLRSPFLSERDERLLQPHIEAVTDWHVASKLTAEPVDLVARILVTSAWCLENLSALGKVSQIVTHLFSWLKLDGLKVQHAWLGLYNLSSAAHVHNGQYAKAIDILEQIRSIYQPPPELDDLKIIAVQHNLAYLYNLNRQPWKAIEILEATIPLQQQELPEYDVDLLRTQCQLASAYSDIGRVQASIELFTNIVRIGKEFLLDDDQHLLHAQHGLAEAYSANEQHEEAVALERYVLEIRERTLPEDHLSRLLSELNLSLYLWNTDKTDDALRMLERVVEIWTQTVHPEHPYRRLAEERLTMWKRRGPG